MKLGKLEKVTDLGLIVISLCLAVITLFSCTDNNELEVDTREVALILSIPSDILVLKDNYNGQAEHIVTRHNIIDSDTITLEMKYGQHVVEINTDGKIGNITIDINDTTSKAIIITKQEHFNITVNDEWLEPTFQSF